MGSAYTEALDSGWQGVGIARRLRQTPQKLETGSRTASAGIPYILLLRIEAIGFPTFGLLLYVKPPMPYKHSAADTPKSL